MNTNKKNTKNASRNYVFMLMIPLFILTLLFSNLFVKDKQGEYYQNTIDTLDAYNESLELILTEALTTLNTLSLVVGENFNNPELIELFLKKSYEADLRYSGLYYTNLEGTILYSGSAPSATNINIAYRDYFKQFRKSEKAVFSGGMINKVNQQYIFTVLRPVRDEKNVLKGALIASIRVDYVKEKLRMLLPNDESFAVYDVENNLIFGNGPITKLNGERMLKSTVSPSNWTLIKNVPTITSTDMSNLIFIAFFISALIVISFFFVIQFILIKQKAVFEQQQAETAKLEMLGHFAASTAHEIKNPLTGIKGLITLLKEKHVEEEEQMYFSIILSEVDRINEIVSELLFIGKPISLQKERLLLNEVIQDISVIIEGEANLKGIVFEQRIAQTPLPIYGSRDYIKQLYLNLCKNGIDAMQKDGTLLIELYKQGNKVILKISDTGVGIPKDNLKKVFQPFFTSKDTGTGLGLVICKRIVDSHNATIAVSSTEDVGTTFTIEFPISE